MRFIIVLTILSVWVANSEATKASPPKGKGWKYLCQQTRQLAPLAETLHRFSRRETPQRRYDGAQTYGAQHKYRAQSKYSAQNEYGGASGCRFCVYLDIGKSENLRICSVDRVVRFVSELNRLLTTIVFGEAEKGGFVTASRAEESSRHLVALLTSYPTKCHRRYSNVGSDVALTSRQNPQQRQRKTCHQVHRAAKRMFTKLRAAIGEYLARPSKLAARHEDRMQGDDPRNPQYVYPLEYIARARAPIDVRTYSARTIDQYFDTSGLTRYLKECTDCVEARRDSTCPLNNQVLEMKKWSNQLQELLSSGCRGAGCGGTGDDACCMSSRPPFATTVVQMTEMLKDVYNLMLSHCQDNCQLRERDGRSRDPTEWHSWSECGPRDQRRTRRRLSDCSERGSERENGRSCLREDVETEACPQTTEPCCREWSSWFSLSQCSTTCGPGERTENRVCKVKVPGTKCSDRESRTVPCGGTNPPCRSNPLGNTVYLWSPIDCDCRRGLARCVNERTQEPVDDAFCEMSNTAGPRFPCRDLDAQCPKCVSDCVGMKHGVYPSCYGCNQFISCSAFGGTLLGCMPVDDKPAQYNAVSQTCQAGPSDTCRLSEPISGCRGLSDGRYHSGGEGCASFIQCQVERAFVRPCPPNMEFDRIEQSCVRQSSTCTRQYKKRPPFDTSRGVDEKGEDGDEGGVTDIPGVGELPSVIHDRSGVVIGGVLWP